MTDLRASRGKTIKRERENMQIGLGWRDEEVSERRVRVDGKKVGEGVRSGWRRNVVDEIEVIHALLRGKERR